MADQRIISPAEKKMAEEARKRRRAEFIPDPFSFLEDDFAQAVDPFSVVSPARRLGGAFPTATRTERGGADIGATLSTAARGVKEFFIPPGQGVLEAVAQGAVSAARDVVEAPNTQQLLRTVEAYDTYVIRPSGAAGNTLVQAFLDEAIPAFSSGLVQGPESDPRQGIEDFLEILADDGTFHDATSAYLDALNLAPGQAGAGELVFAFENLIPGIGFTKLPAGALRGLADDAARAAAKVVDDAARLPGRLAGEVPTSQLARTPGGEILGDVQVTQLDVPGFPTELPSGGAGGLPDWAKPAFDAPEDISRADIVASKAIWDVTTPGAKAPTVKQAQQARGRMASDLTSFPDVPPLLARRGEVEAYLVTKGQGDLQVAQQNVQAARKFWEGPFGKPPEWERVILNAEEAIRRAGGVIDTVPIPQAGRVTPPPSAIPEQVIPGPPGAVTTGGAPPSGRPPAPPTGGPVVPPDGGPPIDPSELLSRFSRFIKESVPDRIGAAEAEVTEELGKRAARAQAALAKGDRPGAFAAFKGELPKAGDIIPPSSAFTPAEGEVLLKMIDTHFNDNVFNWMQTNTAFRNLFDTGRIPVRSQLLLLEEVFGKEFVESILSLRSRGEKIWEFIRELWNMPRALIASGDLSATMRQSPLLATEDGGRIFREAIVQQVKAFKDEAAFTASRDRITSHPQFASSQRAGLDLTAPSTVRAAELTAREEPFIGSRLAAKIPVIGRLVKASERAYVTMLNEMRFGTFIHESAKLGPAATRKELKDLGSTINILTGRANLGPLNEASQMLAGIFFSPRFAVSRFQVPVSVAINSSPARRMAARGLASYGATVLSMLALADLSGTASVDWNPKSSDFLKFRIGKTRIDPWVGLQQPVVLVTRLVTGELRTLSTKETREIDPRDAIARFFENKLAPSTRLLFSLRRGEGFGGASLTDEVPATKAAREAFEENITDKVPIPSIPQAVWDQFVFLFVQDAAEAFSESGPAAGLGVGALAFTGIGANTFGDPVDAAVEETYRSFGEIQGAAELGVTVGKVQDQLTIGGTSYPLDETQHAAYQRIRGDVMNRKMRAYLDTVSVQTPDDAQSASLRWKNDARSRAIREILLPSLGPGDLQTQPTQQSATFDQAGFRQKARELVEAR